MIEDDKTYDLIEAYLNGELKDSSLKAFEDQLEQDPELQDKVNSHKLANLLVKKKGLVDIKSIITTEDNLARRYDTFKKAGIALLIVLLGTLGCWVYQNKGRMQETVPQERTIQLQHQEIKDLKPAVQQETMVYPSTPSESGTKKAVLPEKSIAKGAPAEIAVPEVPHAAINAPVVPQPQPESKKSIVTAVSKTEELKENICAKIVLDAHLSITPACHGDQNGSILVSGYKGGQAPYKSVIYKSDIKNPASAQHLAAGTYIISVQDANGCHKKFDPVELKETDCKKEFAINPSIGEEWEIPVYSASGMLTIYDEKGNVYFSAEIEGENAEKWNGYSSKGELKTGFFPFIIKYQDGTSKDGSISLGK